MIRCTLISPTNLMLEHPLLSPVDESEFFVLGVKEYAKAKKHFVMDGFHMGAIAGLAGAILLMLVITSLTGCAAQKPRVALPQIGAPPAWDSGRYVCRNDHYQFHPETGRCELEHVPGSPGLHFGSEHQSCKADNSCAMVQNWENEYGDDVLTPLGCWLAKARITWILGDRVNQCVKGKWLPTYRVVWKSKITGKKGHGGCLDEAVARAAVERGNREYPEIEHRIQKCGILVY